MKNAKQLNADDLAEIMSDQLRVLTGESVENKELAVADSIANMIGKLLKHSVSRMAYADYKKNGGDLIQALEARNGTKTN